jgi:diphosphomevalonate decarboxylase
LVKWRVKLFFKFKNRQEDVKKERIQNVLNEIRSRATRNKNLKVKITSENNFPTAAGLASSASGYCCLVYTLAQAFAVEGDLSVIARIGSGSACRSMYGGFVKWVAGNLQDGSDSKAIQIQNETFWPEIQILVCVVNKNQKETSSTSGMKESVKTSKLLKERLNILPERILEIEKAISEKDFETFGKITMKDSDDFHDICKDTIPSIFYLNKTSNRIIQLVHSLNQFYGQIKVAYTFDAGPNAVLFVLKKDSDEIESLLNHYFISKNDQPSNVTKTLNMEPISNEIEYIIKTDIGPGPQLIE